jgi:NAD(P)-dependent dehydrogenase (short-subunit alcohol dehydrogenase family)
VSPDAGPEPASGRLLADVVDWALEASVVGSFSRIGIAVRSRVGRWTTPPRLDGKVVIVTGASSGIGRAAAIDLARIGTDLHLVGRDPERLAATQRAVVAVRGGGRVEISPLDLVDPDQVVAFAERVMTSEDRLHGLIHNAGALFPDHRTAPDGTELTVATHVLAPFRLTWLLSPLLRRSPSSVIVTVSSGGMYTQRFDIDRLELAPGGYNGVTSYARAKRAQVVLAHEWARRWGSDGVASYAMHPGWVNTPGLATGLPSFAHLGPLLRTPSQGADTVVWLAADGPRRDASHVPDAGAVEEPSGGIWLDRHRRPEYYLPTTYRSPTRRRRDGDELWQWCAARTIPDAVVAPL